MTKKLYGIYTPATDSSIKKIEQDLKLAIDAGLPWLQIRDKNTDKKYWRLWKSIVQYAIQANTFVLINDSLDLHQYLEHENSCSLGLHLGQDDITLQGARKLTSQETIIGITCHSSLQLAQQACKNNADYVAFGRFFPSLTKPDASPADIKIVSEFHQLMIDKPVPIAVIGGIELGNIHLIKSTPATLYAISNGIWGQNSIQQAIASLNSVLHDQSQT